MMSLDDSVSDDKVVDTKPTNEAPSDETMNESVPDEVSVKVDVANEVSVKVDVANEVVANDTIGNNAAVNDTVAKDTSEKEMVVDEPVADQTVTVEKNNDKAVNDNKAGNEEIVKEKVKEGKAISATSDKDAKTKKNQVHAEKDQKSKDAKGSRGKKSNGRQKSYKNYRPQSGRVKRGAKRPRNRRARFLDVKHKARDIEPWLNPPNQVTGNSWECQAFMPILQNPSYENCGDPNMMMYNHQFNSSSFNFNMGNNMVSNMANNMGNNLGANMSSYNLKRVGLLGDSPYDPKPPYLGYNREADMYNRNEESWNPGSSSSAMNYRRPYSSMNARNRQENLRKKSWAGRKNKRWNKSKRRDQGERKGKKRT